MTDVIMIYDASTDSSRPATQADIDMLVLRVRQFAEQRGTIHEMTKPGALGYLDPIMARSIDRANAAALHEMENPDWGHNADLQWLFGSFPMKELD